MKLCHNRLWKPLFDRGLTHTQMCHAAGMLRICPAHKRDLSDIVELAFAER